MEIKVPVKTNVNELELLIGELTAIIDKIKAFELTATPVSQEEPLFDPALSQ